MPSGQTEAGMSSGLTYVQTLTMIVMPQAFKSMLPAILSQLISLIKDTSLAVIISLPELTHNAKSFMDKILITLFQCLLP